MDVVLLLVMARYRPSKLQFFAKCSFVDPDAPEVDVMPEFPMGGISARVCLRPKPGASVAEDCDQ